MYKGGVCSHIAASVAENKAVAIKSYLLVRSRLYVVLLLCSECRSDQSVSRNVL